MRLLFLLTLLISCSSIQRSPTSINQESGCKHTPTSFHCVKVVEVYDGDTIFIDLPDQHPLFGKRMGVRISGIDTPEIKTKDLCEKARAVEAKQLVEELINDANRIDIIEVERDKYFRILGSVLVDGKAISEVLLDKKLAYPYFGEAKEVRNWCEVEQESLKN